MTSTSLCVRAVLALVVLLYSASLGQSICSNLLTPYTLPVGLSTFPIATVGCSSTSYPTSLDFTFINNGSTGNLTWILYNSSSTPTRGQVATQASGPTTNGSTTACGGGAAPGGVGAGYSLYLGCFNNGSSIVGQCNVLYNISVTCEDIYPTTSSTGPNAAPSQGVDGGVYLAVALIVALMAHMAL
jgi:hypothetical protein